jgi:hypothetical protein
MSHAPDEGGWHDERIVLLRQIAELGDVLLGHLQLSWTAS